jgi:hypothetical protein
VNGRIPPDFRSQVILSHVPQRLPIQDRVLMWRQALSRFVERQPAQRFFEILPSGDLVAWEVDEIGRTLLGPI